MLNVLNLIKLSVGTESFESLAAWQEARLKERCGKPLWHVTRMWPKREAEILSGGSVYWVIRGLVLARQKITGFESITREDGIKRCGILLDPDLRRTVPMPKKAFQGWRYLEGRDAPADLEHGLDFNSSLPPSLEQGLAQIGVLARSRK